MLESTIDVILIFILAIVVSLIVTPILKSQASRMGLMDKSNNRKVHSKPIPVMGGIAIGLSAIIVFGLISFFSFDFSKYTTLLATSFLLLIVGALDDKLSLNAPSRLVVQVLCAFAISASGIRLTSLYGIFGFGELNIVTSYVLTIFLICGVVNAFNLIDGVDGLAGFLAIVGFTTFGIISWHLHSHNILVIISILTGSLLVFLRYNLSSNKIFLGDGGSILLGYILVVIGIELVEISSTTPLIDVKHTISAVFGVFIIPVIDSLRVYYGRLKNGFSPFRADKTHIHHLFLFFNIPHKFTSSIIALSTCVFIAILILTYTYHGLSSSITLITFIFLVLTTILSAIMKMGEWQKKIKELEERF